MYHVVVSDLDGTLLNAQHQLSERTRHTLHKLVEQGKHFVIATGRHHLDVEAIRQQLDFELYLITSNGAKVLDQDGNTLIDLKLAQDIATEILALPQDERLHLSIYQGDEWLVATEHETLKEMSEESGFQYRITELDQVDTDNVSKMFFFGEHELLLPLEAELKARYGDRANIAFSLPECLEIMDLRASKADALAAVLEKKGHSPEHTIAFGDGMNDYEMLKYVKHGVLMGNAHDRLKALLPEHTVTLSHEEDGVAHYVETHLL